MRVNRKFKWQLLGAAALSFFLVNTVDIRLTPTSNPVTLNIGQEAQAKRSGGRSSGGSFKRSSPSRSTPSRSNSPSRSRSSSGSTYRGSSYSSGTPVYLGLVGTYVLIGLIGILGILMLYMMLTTVRNVRKSINASNSTHPVNSNNELDNTIVTVSKIQVGLLAQARVIQTQLTEYTLDADTETPEGLRQLLQESALALLRTPENWTHVSASSKTVRSREEAQVIFDKISIEERSKFSAETLTNVDGKVRQIQHSQPDAEPGSYIVVTLVVGTENDYPLFGDIYSTQDLKQALEKIAAISSEYLAAFELLWTPQSETESLSYDEMLTEYTNLMQIA